MGRLLTLEHGDDRLILEVPSKDEEILLTASHRETWVVRNELGIGDKMTFEERDKLALHCRLGKITWCVLGYFREKPWPAKVGDLLAAAKGLQEWCNSLGQELYFTYVSSSRPRLQMDYSEFGPTLGAAIRIKGELFWLEAGMGLCELQRVGVRPDGTGFVAERRDLRPQVAKGLDRIATDDRGDVLIKRRRVTTKLPLIVNSIAEFAAKFPSEDIVMISYRHPPGKKRRKSEEEEEAEL